MKSPLYELCHFGSLSKLKFLTHFKTPFSSCESSGLLAYYSAYQRVLVVQGKKN